MDIRNRRALKNSAKQSLESASYDPKKLLLIYIGSVIALSLLLTVADCLLEMQINTTGGLSGLGSRAVLSTAQSTLQFVGSFVLPFWEVGYLFAAMRMARRESVAPETLLEGFRRFWPMLRLLILENLIFIGLAIVCIYVSATVFMMLPVSNSLFAVLDPYVAGSSAQDVSAILDELLLDEAVVSAMMQAMIPMYLIFGVLFCLVSVPIYYQYRMAVYVLLDNRQMGALAALRGSRRMMRRNRFALFRLDLSFWWFYMLDALVGAVCYGDLLLTLLGISLPVSSTVTVYAFYVLHLACQFVLYWRAWNPVAVTYATAYDALRQAPPPQIQPQPQNQPWNYS